MLRTFWDAMSSRLYDLKEILQIKTHLDTESLPGSRAAFGASPASLVSSSAHCGEADMEEVWLDQSLCNSHMIDADPLAFSLSVPRPSRSLRLVRTQLERWC